MTTKVVNALKYIGLICLILFINTSCEKEIDNIGVNLIDNGTFNSNSESYEVISNSINIEKVPSSGLSQYLLGSYSNSDFGKLKASFVTQLALPTTGDSYNYGENSIIDSVIVSIPYQVTKQDNYADGRPKFTIDSIIGNTEVAFQVGIYELKTFLNTLDPEDPTKNKIYFSDKEFQKSDTPLYLDSFNVNPNDTVTYISRHRLNGLVYDRDTIKEADAAPVMKFPLNKELVQQLFVDNAGSADFADFESFSRYFRGLYIEASELTNEPSHLISLSLANSKMSIYYSKDDDEEENEDLNRNGINGEKGVRTKHTFTFLFGNIKSNILERNYSNSNFEQGSDSRLFVQGAAGSEASISLFNNNELDEIRTKNWLINDANLTLYIDQNASTDILPEQLFIYNIDENLQIKDMISEGPTVVGGNLQYDEDGNPEKYVFKITDYISDLVKSDDSADLVKLGIRVFNPSDAPSAVSDINMRHYSWNPKGVVLYNHNTNNLDKRVKLNISFTELTN
jgi:hypothetical protein